MQPAMVADIGFRRTFLSTDERPGASNGGLPCADILRMRNKSDAMATPPRLIFLLNSAQRRLQQFVAAEQDGATRAGEAAPWPCIDCCRTIRKPFLGC